MIDFNKLLTTKDLEEINTMPDPSLEQAEMVISLWEKNYINVSASDSNAMFNALVFFKLYKKVQSVYPELFI